MNERLPRPHPGVILLAILVLLATAVGQLTGHDHERHPGHQHATFAADAVPARLAGAGQGAARAGGKAVAHRAGGVPARQKAGRARAPRTTMAYTGTHALEPTLGIDGEGRIFFVGAEMNWIPAQDSNPRLGIYSPRLLRTGNKGRTWTDVNPPTHPITLDPFVHVDVDTGRVFTADIQEVACGTVSFSDDAGESWTTSKPCGLTDHQNLFTGPPPEGALPPIGYPNIAYYCAIDAGIMTASSATGCLKSRDGGLSWVRTGDVAYGNNPHAERGDYFDIAGLCYGGTGHGVVGSDGTVYLPRGWCDQPWLAISENEGATWRRVQVADNGIPFGGDALIHDHEAAVAVDEDGTLYYAWVGRDRLPYLATSTDRGATWSEPEMIGPPGLREAWGPKIVVGKPGRVAVAYIGSTNAPGGSAPTGRGPEYTDDVTWNGYLTVTRDALARRPVYLTGTINDPADPLERGECGIPDCGTQVDFIGLAIGPDGTPWTSMADGCPPPGTECADVGLAVLGGMRRAGLR